MAISILSDAHISAIVGFALSGWITPDERRRAQSLADLLKRANHDAYDEADFDGPGVNFKPCELMDTPPTLSPVEALKLIEYFEYSASELGGYHYHDVAYELRAIRIEAVAKLPGYAEAAATL